MVKANDDVARLVEPASNFLVQANLLRSIVRRSIDIDGCAKLAVEEVRPRGTRLDQVLAVAGGAQAQSLEVVQPLLFEFAVAFAAKAQKPLLSCSNTSGWPGLRTGQLRKQIPNEESVEEHVIRLVPVFEETFVTGLAARIRTFVIERIRVEVTNVQGASRQPRNDFRVVYQLPEDAGTPF
jgi:hypothetical protein